MKRVLVFVATTVACVGLLAGPAAAAGGLKKFNIDDQAITYPPGYGVVSGVLQCNPSATGPTGYRVTLTVTQGGTTGGSQFNVPCNGSVVHWSANLEQDGPFFPGKANACANAAKILDVTTAGQVSSSFCKTIKFVEGTA